MSVNLKRCVFLTLQPLHISTFHFLTFKMFSTNWYMVSVILIFLLFPESDLYTHNSFMWTYIPYLLSKFDYKSIPHWCKVSEGTDILHDKTCWIKMMFYLVAFLFKRICVMAVKCNPVPHHCVVVHRSYPLMNNFSKTYFN